MAHPRTLMWSGVLWAVASCGRLVPQVPRRFALGILLTIIGALILKGCYLSRTVDQATASDVNNQSFTFANGAVFHSALANVSTTLCFTDNATNFTLSTDKTATGTNRFGSCILTVVTSNYDANAGPQVGEVITLDPCDFDSERLTLTVSNRDLTTTSTVATACSPGSSGNGTPATASSVNNQSFTFNSGAVFDSALSNVSTALEFTNNATNFTLTSAGSISGTATGTSTVQSGTCTLTIANSTYTVGTKVRANSPAIKLSPCNFDSTTRKLTVTNAGITATSEASTILSSP